MGVKVTGETIVQNFKENPLTDDLNAVYVGKKGTIEEHVQNQNQTTRKSWFGETIVVIYVVKVGTTNERVQNWLKSKQMLLLVKKKVAPSTMTRAMKIDPRLLFPYRLLSPFYSKL